jgi:hypothetical protein
VTSIEDWTGAGEGCGEPLFYYRFHVRLTKNGILLAEGIGSCNSRESKFRYRQSERKCPQCGKSTIIRGREEYGGGWICFTKRGGCGAKFPAGDRAIEAQSVGRVLNSDIADQVNTIQKMAHKRALVAAVLIATNASEFYTQDVEDMEVIEVPSAEPPHEAKVKRGGRRDADPPPVVNMAPSERNPQSNQDGPARSSPFQEMIIKFAELKARLASDLAIYYGGLIRIRGPPRESVP